MMEFLDYMALVCLSWAVMGFAFLIMAGIFELVDYLSKGRSKDALVNFFEEEIDE